MRLLCIFTLALFLALPARADRAVQNDTSPVRIETLAARSDTPDADDPDDSEEEDEDGDDEDRAPAKTPDPPDPDDNPDEDAPPTAPDKSDALALEIETSAIASTRGEGAIDALVHVSRGAWSGALGGGNGGSTDASQRQWMRAQLGFNPGVAIAAQALWQPSQKGSSQEQIRVSVGRETDRGSWEIALQQQDAQLNAGAAGLTNLKARMDPASPAMELSGGAISLEGAHAIGADSGLRATAQLGAGSYSLTLPRAAATPWTSLAPWDRLGQYALAWPARAQGEIGLALEGNAGTVSAAIGAGLPAQPGGLEAELILAGEHAIGPVTLSLQLCAARLWPGELWMGSLSFGARWKPGG